MINRPMRQFTTSSVFAARGPQPRRADLDVDRIDEFAVAVRYQRRQKTSREHRVCAHHRWWWLSRLTEVEPGRIAKVQVRGGLTQVGETVRPHRSSHLLESS
jgi:hypothetical protein